MNKHTEFLEALSEAPDSQIDKSVCARLKVLSESVSVSSEEIKSILDDCAYAALASDFAMVALDHLWKIILKEEGVAF